MLTAARCWPQGWLVVRTMSQHLIGCWNQRKFESAYSSRGCREWFAIGGEKDRFCRLFFIVLWSYGRKICLNMCHGNSENSYGCSYLLRICFIYGKWVYRGVESLCKLLTANKVPFDLPNQQASANQNTVHLKLVSFESLAGNDFCERGTYTQAEAHCESSIANCEILDQKYRTAVQAQAAQT